MKRSIAPALILIGLAALVWAAGTADAPVYSLSSSFELEVGSHHFQRVKVESNIADTLFDGRTYRPQPSQKTTFEVVYDVEVVEKLPEAGPTCAIFTVKSGRATIDGAPVWAPRPGTRMSVRRGSGGFEIDGFPEYLDRRVADLVRLTFYQVSSETPEDAQSFMPASAKIGDTWPVDLEAFRRMQRGHALSYEDAALQGHETLAARATLGGTDVLVIESNITADGVRLVSEAGMPQVFGSGRFKTQVLMPVDTTRGPMRFTQESHFSLGSEVRNGKSFEREGSGTIQIDFDYRD